VADYPRHRSAGAQSCIKSRHPPEITELLESGVGDLRNWSTRAGEKCVDAREDRRDDSRGRKEHV
jgi:hypothetical protein